VKYIIYTISLISFLFCNLYSQWEILNDGLFMQWLKGIDFVNENYGWLIVERDAERGLLKTEDCGETWNDISLPGGMYLEYIDFKSTSVGWSIGSSEENWSTNIYKTENGGLTWRLSSNLPENFNLRQMAAVNDSLIFITGEIGRTDYCAGWIF
jgi:photosystem II stability/assembly factor-like uncharacterized protein